MSESAVPSDQPTDAELIDSVRSGTLSAYGSLHQRHVNAAYNLALSDDITTISGADITIPFADTAVARLDRSLAARAFARLPERWQVVLWHTEVEGRSAAEVAPILGLTPNGVSALDYRAREGLRQAYLQAHVIEQPNEHCKKTAVLRRGGQSLGEVGQLQELS